MLSLSINKIQVQRSDFIMVTILLAILSGIFSLGLLLISSLPSLDFTLPTGFMDNISSFFNGVAFFLPVSALFALFEIKMLVISFRLFWSFCMRVKSFIPTISGG